MNELEKLKTIDIVSIAEELGFEPRGGGNIIDCKINQLRDERTSSIKLFKDTNSWYDYGSHKGGSNIDLIMETLSIDFAESCKKLKNDNGIVNMDDYTPKPLPKPQPKNYIKPDAIDRLFYENPFTLNINLKDQNQAEVMETIIPLWLLRESEQEDHDFFVSNCKWSKTYNTFMFRYPDKDNIAHTIRYRKIIEDERVKKWKALYNTNADYCYCRLKQTQPTLIVEGSRDFWIAVLMGYSVIALPHGGFEDVPNEILQDREVIFIDDNDGKNYMVKLYDQALCSKKWFDHKDWGLDGKDLADYSYHFDNIESFKEKFEKYIESIKIETIKEKWRDVLDNITKPLNDDDISKIENMEFLYPELIIKNNITTIVAQANTGKSAFTFGLCKELMKDKLKDIFFLDPDSNVSYVKPILEELKDKPFHYYNGIKSNTQDMIKLLETMASLPMGSGKDTMVVCDGLQFFVNGSASEDKNSKGFLELLKKVRDRFGATIILLHHAKREKDENGNSQYLGSQVLESSTDNMLMMQVRDNIEIVVQKSRADKKNNVYNLEMDFEHRVIKSVTPKGDYYESDTDVDITISQEDIVGFMKGKEWIAISNIQKHFKCHRNKARRDLIWNMLKDDKDIEVKKEGKGWKAKYINKEPEVIEYDDDWTEGLL
jgi:hypothetical protein